MASNSLVVDVSLNVIGQPECCRELVADGWRFEWCYESGWISGFHTRFGTVRVACLNRYRTGTRFDANQIGEAIAMLLNGIDGTKNEGQSA